MSRVLPILFNTEMVRAILREVNPKTATRRTIKGYIPDDAVWGYTAFTPKGYISCRGTFLEGYGEKFFKLPCQKGDILYVRETWQYCYELDENDQIIEGTGKYVYAASPEDVPKFTEWVKDDGTHTDVMPWRPSIHMPKEAARIWLKVTDVRVERLQDITPAQAVQEGVGNLFYEDIGYSDMDYGNPVDEEYGIVKEQFAWLWESTLKKTDLDRYGWEANPWVWVIEFERCEKPEESPYAWNDAIHEMTKEVQKQIGLRGGTPV